MRKKKNERSEAEEIKLTVIMIILLVLGVAWVIVEWILLPEIMSVQVTVSGQPGNTMPKIMGIAIPFVISSFFAVLYKVKADRKNLYLSILGLLLPIMNLALNI